MPTVNSGLNTKPRRLGVNTQPFQSPPQGLGRDRYCPHLGSGSHCQDYTIPSHQAAAVVVDDETFGPNQVTLGGESAFIVDDEVPADMNGPVLSQGRATPTDNGEPLNVGLASVVETGDGEAVSFDRIASRDSRENDTEKVQDLGLTDSIEDGAPEDDLLAAETPPPLSGLKIDELADAGDEAPPPLEDFAINDAEALATPISQPYSAPIHIPPVRSDLTIPSIFTSLPAIPDTHPPTATAIEQRETLECIIPFITCQPNRDHQQSDYNEHGIPRLKRFLHLGFLDGLHRPFPARATGYDASRPWLLHWSWSGRSMLEEGLIDDPSYQLRDTLRAAQRPDGGFGGGHGQIAHLAPTYGAVMALCTDSRPESLDMIDRRAMWKWLGSLKQTNGAFEIVKGGEVDIRAAYCAVAIISLLNLPLELPPDAHARSAGLASFLDGLGDWISLCQTYEGGIGGEPNAEAHGAYTFCGVAALSILGEPRITIPRYLDLPALISFLSSLQHAPEGGFAGRTNKLVDACYSHWVAECWPMIEQATGIDYAFPPPRVSQFPEPNGLYDREGLLRYILCCCQQKEGGLRDKPMRRPDLAHTCYALSGLQSTLYRFIWQQNESEEGYELGAAFGWKQDERQEWEEQNLVIHVPRPQDLKFSDVKKRKRTSAGLRGVKAPMFADIEEEKYDRVERKDWKTDPPSEEDDADYEYVETESLGVQHPLFTIPLSAVETVRAYFRGKPGF